MKIAIIIHGPFSDNAYIKIKKSLSKIPRAYSHDIQIVVSCYINDYSETKASFNNFNLFPIRIIPVKDVINPGFFNINRQLVCVNEALSIIEDDVFVIKLRNDMWLSWKKLFHILKNKDFLSSTPEKFITTNCFTRKDRLYHPSDMFLCGFKKTISTYYSYPLTEITQTNWQLLILRNVRNSTLPFYRLMFSPESELFSNFLKLNGWTLKNTLEDSFEAISKYCYVINTWDINLRWNKKRNAFLPSGTIILPYRFSLEPFPGAPKENAVCYSRHDFGSHKTLKDIFFLLFSRIVFALHYRDKKKQKEKIIKTMKRFYHSRFFPNFMKHIALKIYNNLRK